MKQSEIEKKFEEIESRLKKLEESKLVGFDNKLNTHALEGKKDKDEAQDVSLSADTNYESGKTTNTEQMPRNEDTDLPENSPQTSSDVSVAIGGEVKSSSPKGESIPADNVPRKRGRPSLKNG